MIHKFTHRQFSNYFTILFFMLLAVPSVLEAQCVVGNTGGVVWRDANGNGIKEGVESFGVSGVTVKLFNSTGALISTQTTDASGQYTFGTLSPAPSTTAPYRVEFSNIPAPYKPTFKGSNGQTDVQFVTAANCSIYFGVNNPADYCQPNPLVALTCFSNGDPLTGGTAADKDALVSFNYTDATTSASPTPSSMRHEATTTQVGSVFGLAYHTKSKKLFSASFLKRHVGWGPLGVGGIYVTSYSGTTATTSSFIDLASMGLMMLPAGAPTTILTNSGRGLSNTVSDPSSDTDAFLWIGKVGLGDMELSEDGNTLYAMNLAQRNITKIDITNYIATGTLPTAADISSITIPLPTCNNGVNRPFGLKIDNGTLYVGTTCTGENAGATINDVNISVLAYNIGTSTWSTALSPFTMDYIKGQAQNSAPAACLTWNTWAVDTSYFFDSGYFGTYGSGTTPPFQITPACRPAPMLSDMEIDEKGNMTLGIVDISGHQWGFANYPPIGTDTRIDWRSGGEVLKASRCTTGSLVLTMESNGGLCGATSADPNQRNSEGPGGGEFYYTETGYLFGGTPYQHKETSLGTLALKKFSGEVLLTVYDPYFEFSGGVNFLNNTNGSANKLTQIYYDAFGGTINGTSGKANGLGDMELLCSTPPLEIGNYVWQDTNGNGVQEPTEPPLSNITVSLWKGGTQIASTVTDRFGQYYFSSASATGVTWTGTGADTMLLPLTNYEVRINTNTVGTITSINSTANNGNDSNDADESIVGNYAVIAVTTGTDGLSNHTFDFGFNMCVTASQISGSQNICVGGDPVAFTEAAPAVGTGTLTYQWQISTTDTLTGYTDISGAISNTYDPPSGITQKTYYRVVVTNTLGTTVCTANSNSLIIAIPNTVTAGTLTASYTVCASTATTITNTAAATGSGTLTYQWQISTTDCTTGFTDIAGATAASYTIPAGSITQTTYFRRWVTSTLSGLACQALSNCTTVYLNSITPNVVADDQYLCGTATPAAFTMVSPASGSGTLTYLWQKSTTSCTAGMANISGATTVAYTPVAVTVAGNYYRLAATSTLNGVACVNYSNCITVNMLKAPVISADKSACVGSQPTAITVTTAAVGPVGFTYQWQSSTTDCTTGFTDIAGATTTSYTPPTGFSQTTYYRLVVSATINGVLCTQVSNCSTIFLNTISAGTIAGNQTICSNGATTAFTSVTPATGAGTVTYTWLRSATSCTTGFASLGVTTATYTPPTSTVTYYYRRLASSLLSGVTCRDTSNCISVVVNNVTGGTPSSPTMVCKNGNPAAITMITAPTGTGVLSYQWQSSLTNVAANFVNITDSTRNAFDPPAGAVATTYYRLITTSTFNGLACTATSGVGTAIINTVSAGVVGASQSFCTATGNPVITTTTTAASGVALSYQWISSTVDCSTGLTNVAGAIAATYDAPILSQTTYYRRVVTSTSTAVCKDTSNCLKMAIGSPLSYMSQKAPTCANNTANNDGAINLTSSTGTHYGVSLLNAATYNGPTTIATATVMPTVFPAVIKSGIPNTGGSYIIRIFNGADACFKDTTITVAAVACPCATASISPTTVQVCSGTGATLTATGGGTYLWSNGATTAAATVSPTTATTYTVTVTGTNGCTATASQLVTVTDTTLAVRDTVVCGGLTVNLFALTSGVKGVLTYSTDGTTWAALTDPTNVTPSVTTTYYIKDSLATSCLDIDTMVITINPAPTAPFVISPANSICPLTSVDLTAISSALAPSVSGGVLEWHVSNSSSSAIVSNQTAVTTGDYYLFEKSPLGCYSDGSKVHVQINSCCPPKICVPVTVTRN